MAMLMIADSPDGDTPLMAMLMIADSPDGGVCDVETTHSIEEAAIVLHQPCTGGSQDAEYRYHCREADDGHIGMVNCHGI